MKQKLTFDEWLAKIHIIATKAGYELKGGFMMSPELAYWKEQYENGVTPRKAWNRA